MPHAVSRQASFIRHLSDPKDRTFIFCIIPNDWIYKQNQTSILISTTGVEFNKTKIHWPLIKVLSSGNIYSLASKISQNCDESFNWVSEMKTLPINFDQ